MKQNIKAMLWIFFIVYFFVWGFSGFDIGKANASELGNVKIGSGSGGDGLRVFLDKDIEKGYQHEWRITYRKEFWKPYMLNISSEEVRHGDTSLRFEIRAGDCGQGLSSHNDCEHNSERIELIPYANKGSVGYTGTTWHSFSFFIKEFDVTQYGHNSIFQFHYDNGQPGWNWNVYKEGLVSERRTACNLKKFKKKYKQQGCSAYSNWAPYNDNRIIIPAEEMFDQWHDVVFHVKWSKKQTGFLKMWVNGELVYHYIGSTLGKDPKGKFQFGLYRSTEDHNFNTIEQTQITYYDELRYAKKHCKKLGIEELGYTCAELEYQEVHEGRIDRIFDIE